MLTEVGKFLRKLRIDRGEILKDMSAKLDVSVAFLSAVETGKKTIPIGWFDKISQMYDLTTQQKEEFMNAIAETKKYIEVDLTDVNDSSWSLAVSFARGFRDFDEVQINKLRSIICNNGEDDNK